MRKQDFPQDVQAYLKKHTLKTWGTFLGLVLAFGLILFFFGEQLFGESDWQLCTIDTIHPNDLGFYRIAKTLEPVMKRMLTN